MTELSLAFGALAPPIAHQLDDKGLSYDENAIAVLQGHIEAANRLRIHGILPDAQSRLIGKKIMRKVIAALHV